jgi:hypothetical protein
MCHAGWQPRSHWQQRLGTIECLNLRFLVNAQHNGPLGRVHIQADDVRQLGRKLGIGAELEGLHAMRLQTKFLPNPMYVP